MTKPARPATALNTRDYRSGAAGYPRDYREPDFVTVWVVEVPIYGDCVGGRKQVGWEPWTVYTSRADALWKVREMKKPQRRPKLPKLPKGHRVLIFSEPKAGRVRKFVLAPGQRIAKRKG